MDSHGLEQNNEVDMDQDDIEQVVTFRSQRQCSPDPDSRHSPELQEDGDVQEDEDERLLAAAVMDPGMMAFARKSIMMNSRTEPRSIFQRFMSSTSKNPASMTSSAPKTTDDRSHDTLLRSKVQPASNHLAETALNLVDGSGGLQPGIESKIREEPGSIGSGTPKKTKPISSAASSVPPLWSTPKSKDICTKSNVTLQSSSSARIQPPPGLFSKVEPKPETKSTIPPTENKNNEDIQPPKPIIDFSDSSFTHRLPTWKTRRLGSGRQSYQSQSQPSQPQSALQGAYSRSGHYDHVQKDMSAADKNVFVSSSRSIIVSQVESVVRTSDVSESEREALEPMLEDTVDPVTTAGADLALTDAQDTPSTSIQDTQPSPPALTSPKRPVLFSLSDILRQDSESRAPYRLPNLTAQLDGSESVASASAHARKTTFGSGSSHGSRLFSPYSVPSIADRGVLRSQRTEATGTRSNVGAIVPSTPSFRARPFNPKVFTSAGDLGVPRVAKRPLTVPKSPVFSERRRAKDADRQQMGNPVTSAATRLKRMIGTAGQERDRERRK
ncbi:hypothetical protein BGW38_004888 [Lunasporangiospora selenospora]|uniref:Uncharacterized protein n=1 Tax=Lunasporangiospora selenospora TaxID=979761 RepID=A0A9P6KHF6_9FUNG|nr:hypothetical protein BGW38_004888 [Lunasporangiospora selenospora]